MTITPGPWFTLTGFEGGVIVSTEVGPQWAAHVVAEVKRPEDGRLIKAAPALLEALDESTTALEFALAGESVPAELVNRIQRNLDLIHEVKGE